METIEFVKKAEGGKIVIDVPANLNGKDLLIKISEQEHEKSFQEMSAEERLNVLKKFRGSAKYPGTDISKYNVYDQ